MAIHTLPRQDTGAHSAVTPPPKIILRRTGKKPLRFSGVCLCEATGYTRGGSFWYEVGLYRRETRGFVASVRLFTKSQGAQDRHSAVRVDSLSAALDYLESYDVTADVRGSIKNQAKTAAPAQDMLRAARLRGAIARYQLAYDSVCTHVLYDMDAQNRVA
ncbi:MAG: hypothetical protein AAF337_00305 [Pseudomonadota bacterium]